MKEHPSQPYPARTKQNVQDADATVWIGKADGLGFRCTMNAAFRHGKPFLNNSLRGPGFFRPFRE
jgi:hypothetical protein